MLEYVFRVRRSEWTLLLESKMVQIFYTTPTFDIPVIRVNRQLMLTLSGGETTSSCSAVLSRYRIMTDG